ncbi:MAG: GNAT family N-acetyltransferase [Acidimicrobiia bacterium]
MSRVSRAAQAVVRRYFPRGVVYEGGAGTAWLVGFDRRAPSVADFFCGDDMQAGSSGRVWRNRLPGQIEDFAVDGGLSIVQLRKPDKRIGKVLHRAIAVPLLVKLHTLLPADQDDLRAQLLTSTTREDFRRIRKANFTYRITKDPEEVRDFYDRHYTPLLTKQFPDDGRPTPLSKMLKSLEDGGELVCADIDGEWVAGIYNVAFEARYELRSIGIRDADDAVRQKRVVSALIVRSLERAVELGRDRATLGRSIPFLGKGPVWFKAKWGGIVTRDPGAHDMYMFMDLRHEAVRRMLSASPIIHFEGDALVTSTWLEPGEKALQTTVREASRFPGISRWYVLAEPETLLAGAEQLAANEQIVPVPVSSGGDRPLWLGEVLSTHR